MKTRKNMLRSSVAMLLVSVLALTTATYAWFTTGNGGKVEQITLTAATADGIELSADAENWSGTITYNALKAVTTNQMMDGTTDKMEPLSSFGTVSAGVLKLYTGTIDNESGTFTASENSASAKNYVRFDFYVRNTNSADATLYLNLNDASVSEDTENSPRTTGVENAVRVAFINQGGSNNGIVITGTSDDVGNAKDLKNGDTSTVWEPNGSDEAAVVKGTIPSSSDKDSITVENGVAKGSSNLTVLATVNEKSENKYVALATIGENHISKVTVYIWLEGQDKDCTNNASGGVFNVNLVFTNKDLSQTSSVESGQ